MKPLNVLSLFDGISCGRLALQRAGVSVASYYASEIDEYAIKVAKKNFPDTLHVGDVRNVKASDFPKIDLLIGGSPCTGFSLAGKRLDFNDPQSVLFFQYLRILNEAKIKNPDLQFLLENVRMKVQVKDAISDLLGVQPVGINSALVSAQNRERLYWANFPIIPPEDKDILLRDILLNGATDREKSHAILASVGRTTHREYLQKSQGQMVLAIEESSQDLPPSAFSGTVPDTLIDMSRLYLSDKAIEYMERDYYGLTRYEKYPNKVDGKSGCVTANMFKGVPYGVIRELLRRLHPIECERLQTLPDNYTDVISNTQRYKCIGNGWTVDVIAHIFKQLK